MAERFVAHVSKGRTLLLLAGALIFVAAGLWFLLDPAEIARSVPVARSEGLVEIFGGLAVVFFGLCAVIIARQLFRTEAVMEIGPEGLLWRRWSPHTIPWSAFEHAGIAEIQRQRMLTLWLADPNAHASTTLLGRTVGANKALGFGDITLSAAGLDRGFEEMATAVRENAPHLFD
jgi:hypothetical protein